MKKQKRYEEQFSTLTFFYDIWHFAMYGNEPPKPLTHEEQLARIKQLRYSPLSVSRIFRKPFSSGKDI